MEDEAAESGQGTPSAKFLHLHIGIITPALPVKAGSVRPFSPPTPNPASSPGAWLLWRPLLFEAALDFTLCLRALCFRSPAYHPYSQPV